MDELTIPPNEGLHAEMKRLESENYHLKRQLKNKNHEIKGMQKYIRKMEKQLKDLNGNKQHYRNGQKRGRTRNG